MICTKHAFIIVTLSVAVFLLSSLFWMVGGVKEVHRENNLFLVEEEGVFGVAHTSSALGTRDKQGFIEKVRLSLSQAPEEESSMTIPEVAPEEEPVVIAQGVISSRPERGAVFACADAEPSYVFDIPGTTTRALAPHCIPTGQPIGILNSGGFLYSGVLESDHQADSCNGYLGSDGVYHYHGDSPCISASPEEIVGYAFDGYLILSSVEHGAPVTNDMLDACHGHEHTILRDGIAVTEYHYHMNDTYPYAIGCFMGEPIPAT